MRKLWFKLTVLSNYGAACWGWGQAWGSPAGERSAGLVSMAERHQGQNISGALTRPLTMASRWRILPVSMSRSV